MNVCVYVYSFNCKFQEETRNKLRYINSLEYVLFHIICFVFCSKRENCVLPVTP